MNEAQKNALDAMISAVEGNMGPFVGSDQERYIRRVLEDLQAEREALEPHEQSPQERSDPERTGRPPDRERIVLIRDVVRDSGIGLKEAKRLCEEAGYDRDRAMATARERRES